MKLNLICLLIVADPLMVAAEANPPLDAPRTGDALSLDQVVSAVLSNNPSLKAARANWEAMKERIPQARAWEDLRVGVDALAGRFVDVPPNAFTDFKYSAEQNVPLSGKNLRRGEVAVAEAAAALAEARRRELDLTARARAAYFQLANAHEQLGLNQKNVGLLRQFADISRAKYEAGTKPESDVLAAQIELSRLEEARFDIQRRISDAQSQINVLMNRPAQSPLGRPGHLPMVPLMTVLEDLQALALGRRPELIIAQRRIEAAQSRVALARREWIPDPNFRVEAARYNDASQAVSEVMAGVSFNLPWFNRKKYRAGVAEAKKNLESAEFLSEAAKTETLGLVRDQLKKVETFHHHSELFRDKIIPLARQNATATRLSYETDRTGFLNLIDAQRTLQEVEADYLDHLADYLVSLAELEAVVGAKLNTPSTAAPEEKK